MKERKKFLRRGRFGQLIDSTTERAAFLHEPFVEIKSEEGNEEYCAYNTKINNWELKKKMDIVRTYSFLPVPQNKAMELDYFVRTCGLINHEIIWSKQQIPRSVFAQINSNTNIEAIAKFTITPWLPTAEGVCKFLGNGFMEYNDSDFIFGM